MLKQTLEIFRPLVGVLFFWTDLSETTCLREVFSHLATQMTNKQNSDDFARFGNVSEEWSKARLQQIQDLLNWELERLTSDLLSAHEPLDFFMSISDPQWALVEVRKSVYVGGCCLGIFRSLEQPQ